MSTAQNEKRVLYVSNIARSADEDALRTRFSQYGKVAKLNLIERDRSQIAFVEYETTESASFALYHLNNADIHGVRVKVNYARDRQDKNEKKKGEQQNDEDKTKTETDDKEPKEKTEKTPTVIERPDTPVGGMMKSSGKNSPSQKKQKVNVKEIQHPKVESPQTNRNTTTETTKANTNQQNKTKTTTQEEKKTTTPETTKANTNEKKNENKNQNTQNTTQNTTQNNTEQKTTGKKGGNKKKGQNKNANTGANNANTGAKTEDSKTPTYFEIIVRNTQDKSETVVGRITSKGPVIDDKAGYERYVAVLSN